MPFPVMTPRVDGRTGSQLVLNDEEHRVHIGQAFVAIWESPAGTLPTNVGEETAIGFVTPELPTRIHLTVDVWADDESVFEIREDPAITLTQGTPYLPLNRLRSSLNASAMRGNVVSPEPPNAVTTYTVAQANAGNLAGGTILHHETLAIGGTGPFTSSGNTTSRGQREIILLPDTEYVVILTTSTVNDTIHNIILNWSEITDGEFVN